MQVVVVGNAKGGAGKSTVAMHLIGHLLHRGRSVAAIDADGRQQTLAHYIEHRQRFLADHPKVTLPIPNVQVLGDQAAALGDAEAQAQLMAALNIAQKHADVVVIDCPGADSPLARSAHALADVLVTPINDSFIDLDLLARVSPDHRVVSPSSYSEAVWEQRKKRFLQTGKTMHWWVVRNRVSSRAARNKQRMAAVLDPLAASIGFSWLDGLFERVIYRELFLLGLTLSDLRHVGGAAKTSLQHIAARQEVRDLVAAIGLNDGDQQKVAS